MAGSSALQWCSGPKGVGEAPRCSAPSSSRAWRWPYKWWMAASTWCIHSPLLWPIQMAGRVGPDHSSRKDWGFPGAFWPRSFCPWSGPRLKDRDSLGLQDRCSCLDGPPQNQRLLRSQPKQPIWLQPMSVKMPMDMMLGTCKLEPSSPSLPTFPLPLFLCTPSLSLIFLLSLAIVKLGRWTLAAASIKMCSNQAKITNFLKNTHVYLSQMLTSYPTTLCTDLWTKTNNANKFTVLYI